MQIKLVLCVAAKLMASWRYGRGIGYGSSLSISPRPTGVFSG